MNEIEEIKKLKSRYFRGLDTIDWDAFRDVFTDDFVSDTTGSGGKVINGADNFLSYIKKHFPPILQSTVATCQK